MSKYILIYHIAKLGNSMEKQNSFFCPLRICPGRQDKYPFWRVLLPKKSLLSLMSAISAPRTLILLVHQGFICIGAVISVMLKIKLQMQLEKTLRLKYLAKDIAL